MDRPGAVTLVDAVAGDVRVVDDVAAAFAQEVIAAFALRPGPRFSLLVSGGPTAQLCYAALAAQRKRIAWQDVDVFWGDERCVPADDPASNQRLVREALLSHLPEVGSIHPMSCSDGPDAYGRLLAGQGPFDLVHLGLGPDGHTASLFPGSGALSAGTGDLVALAEDPSGRNPHRRMTVTLTAIARARRVVFTVAGAAKADALAAVLSGEDVPASRVRAASVLWLVDRAARPRPAGATTTAGVTVAARAANLDRQRTAH